MNVTNKLIQLRQAIDTHLPEAERGPKTIDGMISAAENIQTTNSSIEFYECTAYTPNFAGGIEYSIIISGAPDENANGKYVRKKYIDPVDESVEYYDGYTAVWEKSNGYKLTESYSWGEYYHSITDSSGNEIYCQDGPVWNRLTDYSQVPWADCNDWMQISLTVSPWQTAELPATQESWSGSKVQQDKSGAWVNTGTLSENMPVVFLKPKVGDIYSADTSIRVRKMYDGTKIPITADGLVFYAPLQSDYVDLVSCQAATVTGGTFTEHNNLSCLELDGTDYVKWDNNSDLPAGNTPYSFIALIAPTDNYDWKCYISMGNPGKSEICIHAKNGRLEEFGANCITPNGRWQCIALTRDDTGGAKAYYNGNLQGSGSRTNSVPAPACVCVGANIVDFGQKFSGCIAFAAIYNRELSAAEVLEIHNILLEIY